MNDQLNAVILVADRVGHGPGPLAGVPIAIKDCIDVAGLRTSNGSALRPEHRANADAAIVERLRAAGAALVAKTHLTEFCFGATGENHAYGDCRNPWDPARIPGGSSSGAAVAVASGMVRMAVGTDTGGSIRVPAALCGVVGLRPTHGRVSNRGVLPLSLLCDTVGPIAATVAEVARLFAVMQGFDPADPASRRFAEPAAEWVRGSIRGLRIGIPRRFFFEGLDPDVALRLEEAGCVLEQAGARLVDVPVADPQGLAEHRAFRFVLADVADARADLMQDHAARLGPEVWRRITLGQAVTGAEYASCLRALWRWKAELRSLFAERADVIVTPTVPVTAPLWTHSRDMVETTRVVSRLTYDVGAAGVPSMSVPCGFDRRGLPVGAQLIAPWGAEALLFQVGAVLERELAITTRPQICSN